MDLIIGLFSRISQAENTLKGTERERERELVTGDRTEKIHQAGRHSAGDDEDSARRVFAGNIEETTNLNIPIITHSSVKPCWMRDHLCF